MSTDSSLPLSVLTALDEYRDAVRLCESESHHRREDAMPPLYDREAKFRAALLHSLREMAQEAQGAYDVLSMIRERLVLFLGEESMRGCPPMFYDDAIRSIAHKAAFGKLPEGMYPEGSLLHRLREAEAEVQRLRTPQPETRP